MSRRTTRWSFLFGATLVLAACGGGGGTSPAASDDGGGGGTAATTAPEATTAPGATAAPTADSGSGGGGGDFAGKVCDLVTLEEMSAVLSVAATQQEEQPFTQGSGTCIYKDADGNLLAATGLIGGSFADAKLIYDSYANSPDVVVVPVNGGNAIWFTQNAVAIVNKNGYNGSIQALMAKDGDIQGASTSLLQTLADRMP